MTTTALTFRGRLPGVDCNPALPVVDQPVRLDVAGFVGFAERGPLDVAVPVEDMSQYASVFGGDLAVAQDDGSPVYAQLPTAVRAFFDNGGRRCYVVRVAGKLAVAARFAVPGLQIWRSDGATANAAVSAAWEGSWSAGVSVETALSRTFLRPAAGYTKRTTTADGILPLKHGETVGIQQGDLLRLDLGPAEPGLFVRVHTIDAAESVLGVDLELAFTGGAPGVPATPAPADLAGLPPSVPTVATVELLRFDVVARQHTESDSRVLDQRVGLGFGSWTDVLQAASALQPDPDRSYILRQDPATMTALASGLAVPVGMAQPGTPLDLDAPVPPPLVVGLDDLDTFDPTRFVDDNLAADTIYSVVGHADQLTWVADPSRLRGVHALIGVDEVALVAVPDAGQRGWTPRPTPPPDPPPVPPEVPPLDWSDFRCCDDQPAEPPPVSTPVTPTPVDGLPDLDPVTDYDEDPLVAVQVALVTMCAARADQVSLLSVPRHYDVAATLAWRARVTTDPRISDAFSAAASPLSYAGFWHPWLSVATGQVGSQAVLRDIPPDGVVAGMIAARELSRGAWIAPAGTPLSDVVRVHGVLSDTEAVRLFDAHANLIVQHPGAFSALSAHTLSGNSQQLQLSVRRLLILLRKIALLLGARYTFEVNNDRFRQLVRMRFDRILAALTARGALHAYRVVTDGSINTFEDQDNGRFIVSLQIAPTSPIEFITVTLVRSGEGLLEVLEG